MKDKLNKALNKDKDVKFWKTVINIKECLKKICFMDWVNTNGEVELIFMEILSKENVKDKVFGYQI